MNTTNDDIFLDFQDISFSYPDIEGDLDEDGNQIYNKNIFEHFNAELPGGFTSLIGPNGSGKSTLMLLASGRLFPKTGNITINVNNEKINTRQFFSVVDQESKVAFTAKYTEEERNLIASVIYQNMEFETEEKVEFLLNQVLENGNNKQKDTSFFKEVCSIFELESILSHSLTHLSKGEIQRVLLGFSILYGSSALFMDEPLFAMEQRQKESSLEYLKEYSKKTNTPIWLSMHELELSKKYAENVLLFYPDRRMDFGSPEDVLTKEDLEDAYGVPLSMLKDSEKLTRNNFIEDSKNLL